MSSVASPLRLTSNTTRSSAFTRHLWSTRPQYARETSSSCGGANASPFCLKVPARIVYLLQYLNTRTFREEWTPAIFKSFRLRSRTAQVQQLCDAAWFVDKHDLVFRKFAQRQDAIGLTQSASSSPQVRFPCLNCISSTRFTKTSRFLWRKCEKEQT